jgi:hypothetical protein
MRPAHTPNWRFTSAYNRGIDSTPANAWGRARANPFTPNTYADAACTQNPRGGLSTDTEPPGSNEAKKKLRHEVSMLCTVAA